VSRSSAPSSAPTMISHGRISLALHHLVDGEGPNLLLLHGLGEATPEAPPTQVAQSWRGPIYGLDFTGHGDSSIPRGGGYTSETLVADADAALRHVGSAVLVGRGLGAYVALLLAGLRSAQVPGVVLSDGPGIAGGGTEPGSPSIVAPAEQWTGTPDPWALTDLATDVRPQDYAQAFARFVLTAHPNRHPLWVCAHVRPPWLEAVVDEAGVLEGSIPDALADLEAGLR
jgi:pimeloyl-ACP methyl ester carboxylesterase